MAILSRDNFFSRLHETLGENTSDDSIAFLEDMTDTYNDLERRANGDGTNWEQKYKELDESWKKRYRHRFFSGGESIIPGNDTSVSETEVYKADEITVSDLFTEKKGV